MTHFYPMHFSCAVNDAHHLVSASLCVAAVEAELLHTYVKVDPRSVLTLCVRLAVLVAVTLTIPVVLFPVSNYAEKLHLLKMCLTL